MSDWLPFDVAEELIEGVSLPEAAEALLGNGDDLPDAAARSRAVDPQHNVVLEASAGTGKTHVLVERYLNLLRHGVDPANILAITFTRKAAAEMRGRILAELRKRAESTDHDRQLWRDIRERGGDIAISTIDAFCLSLLHEFPLEANLDPGFEMADETQVPRLMEESLDRALDIARGLSRKDDYVQLLFAELRESRLRSGLAAMIHRRLVVEDALERALELGPRDLTAERACEHAFDRLRHVFAALAGGVERFLADGPVKHRRYQLLMADIRLLMSGDPVPTGLARVIIERLEDHFLVERKRTRQRFSNSYSHADCISKAAWKAHLDDIQQVGDQLRDVLKGFRRDLNAVLSRGVQRTYAIALREYHRTLDTHGVLDFPETLARALAMLEQMEEFARSRYRLEGRYHHVLLDEFQDTSRAQWLLVALLIRSWGEGSGVAEQSSLVPSIFLVGDRKQSIYAFRDADVGVMEDAVTFVDNLRAVGDSRRAISTSFRAAPPLLAFANDLFTEIEKDPSRRDAFRFDDRDHFPVPDVANDPLSDRIGIVAAPTVAQCADIVSAEIKRLVDESGVSPRHIAILFRTKDSHQEFERALERRDIPSYVYKGLGFFEADEIKDVVALLRYLALPDSNLRAAAFLRSRFVRLSDPALQMLAPNLAAAIGGGASPTAPLGVEDRLVLDRARASASRWLHLVDRLPPAELLERVLEETAYAFETRGPRARQARENLKKVRTMIRRVQNRGYTTMSRLSEHLDRLTAGDESNAVIDAGDAVSLMTIHAAKGLEFPVVFVVNLSKGTGGRRSPIRVVSDSEGGRAWLSVSDFQSEADEDAKAKEREETKRLLYVALTRAKERIYIASEAKDAKYRAWPGSLADVLPASLQSKFEAAAGPNISDRLEWVGPSGQAHLLKVCRPDQAPEFTPKPLVAPQARVADNFAPLGDAFAVPRIAVTSALAPAKNAFGPASSNARVHSLAGTLVHRLFERRGAIPADAAADPSLTRELMQLIRDDESVEVDDVDAVIASARDAYVALCAKPALTSVLASGDPAFEVPFSVRVAGTQTILRGTFDCLVRRRDGGVTVVELKTGKPLPEHIQQLEMYLTAARALFPGTPVEGTLVYAHELYLDDRPLHTKR